MNTSHDHLGFEYKWSVYSPVKKSEILEAERSKDELRDIMSRMIGAEIRYTRNEVLDANRLLDTTAKK